MEIMTFRLAKYLSHRSAFTLTKDYRYGLCELATINLFTMKEEQVKKIARILLGANLVFAGLSHLTFARKPFRAQVPDWLPLQKDDTVIYSGIAEIVLGSALIFTNKANQETVGKIAAGFFVAVFPGNIAQYTHHRNSFGLNTDNKRLFRLFFQPVLVAWALKSTSANSEISYKCFKKGKKEMEKLT